jgi:hypothetical protein
MMCQRDEADLPDRFDVFYLMKKALLTGKTLETLSLHLFSLPGFPI